MPRGIVELAVDHQIGHPLQRGGDEFQRARRVGGGERGLGVGGYRKSGFSGSPPPPRRGRRIW